MNKTSAPKITIRGIRQNDYRSVKRLERIIVNEYLQYLTETGEDDSIEPWITIQYFNHYARTGSSFVAEINGKVIGFILAKTTSNVHAPGKQVWLEYVFVLPEARRKGIGRRLLSKVVEYAHKKGITLLYTTLNPNNPESARLLVKQGFEIRDWKFATRKLSKNATR